MTRLASTSTSTFRCYRILSRKARSPSAYGAYRESDGFCERALFVIDRQGIISWNYLSPVAVNPGADGILHALEQLPTRQQVPMSVFYKSQSAQTITFKVISMPR